MTCHVFRYSYYGIAIVMLQIFAIAIWNVTLGYGHVSTKGNNLRYESLCCINVDLILQTPKYLHPIQNHP